MALLYRKYLSNIHPLRSSSILHCDAAVILKPPHYYLVLDWSRGGSLRIALDVYVITPDYLAPVWIPELTGKTQYWDRVNNSVMARVHKTVVQECFKARLLPDVTRVSLLAHYIHQYDEPAITVQNYYKGGNYRGRPAKPRTTLPDIL